MADRQYHPTIQSFLQAYQIAQQRKAQQEQLAQRQLENQQENTAREARMKLEQERMKQIADQFKLEQDIKKRQMDLDERRILQGIQNSKFKQLEDVAKGISSGLINPGGLPTAPQVDLPELGTAIPADPNKVLVGGEAYNRNVFTDPLQMADMQAKARQKLIPVKAEEAGAVAKAQTEATLPAKLEIENVDAANRLREAETKATAEAQLQKQRDAEAMRRVLAQNANRTYVARLRLQGDQKAAAQAAADNHSVLFERAIDGTETVETLVKNLPQKQREGFINAAKQNGITVLNDRDLKSLDEVRSLGNVIRAVDEFNAANASGENVFKLKNRRDQITGQLGNLAKTVGGEKGALSKNDIQRAEKLIPDVFTPIDKDYNPRVTRQLKEIYSRAVKKAFPAGMSDKQKAVLKEKYSILEDAPQKGTYVKEFQGRKYNVVKNPDGSETVLGIVQ